MLKPVIELSGGMRRRLHWYALLWREAIIFMDEPLKDLMKTKEKPCNMWLIIPGTRQY